MQIFSRNINTFNTVRPKPQRQKQRGAVGSEEIFEFSLSTKSDESDSSTMYVVVGCFVGVMALVIAVFMVVYGLQRRRK